MLLEVAGEFMRCASASRRFTRDKLLGKLAREKWGPMESQEVQPPDSSSSRFPLHIILESPTMPLVLEDDVVMILREAAKVSSRWCSCFVPSRAVLLREEYLRNLFWSTSCFSIWRLKQLLRNIKVDTRCHTRYILLGSCSSLVPCALVPRVECPKRNSAYPSAFA